MRIAATRLGENPALAGLKHCNRLEQVLARASWSDAGIAEALLFSSSRRARSGTMSNVFLVHGPAAHAAAGRLRRGRRHARGGAEAAAAAGIPAPRCALGAAELERRRRSF